MLKKYIKKLKEKQDYITMNNLFNGEDLNLEEITNKN